MWSQTSCGGLKYTVTCISERFRCKKDNGGGLGAGVRVGVTLEVGIGIGVRVGVGGGGEGGGEGEGEGGDGEGDGDGGGRVLFCWLWAKPSFRKGSSLLPHELAGSSLDAAEGVSLDPCNARG